MTRLKYATDAEPRWMEGKNDRIYFRFRRRCSCRDRTDRAVCGREIQTMTFAFRLRLLRKKRKVTAKQLAAALRINYQSVYVWENGRSFPRIDYAILIADFFNVSLDYLTGRSDMERPPE